MKGPGQGSVLRLQGLPFRPDWETVVGAVIDYVQVTYPQLANRIIIKGDSFGGYLAARAAAEDKRIAGCIVNPGIVDSSGSLEKLKSKIIRNIMFSFRPDLKFKICSRYMRFGAKSFDEFFASCKKFTMEGRIKSIVCPTLVIDNQEEHLTKGEAIKFLKELQSPKAYYCFNKEDVAGGHCQPFAQLKTQEIIYNWLDDTYKNDNTWPDEYLVL